ncbi:MAG: flavin reductase family protein [Candidatus Aminicenantes bacterium]|nr:flavin reductase family protein [Candidatus Aminicenantes bacterium]
MKKSLGAKPIAYPAPVWVVGSYDSSGKPNLMTAAWGGICCSNPPSITISLRKGRYTFQCIKESKGFTVNIPSEKYAAEADYVGMVSGKDVDKFAVTGLTEEKAEFVDAPYVKEFPLILECTLSQTHKVGVHIQFIGTILDVKADESVLGDDDLPLLDKIKPILFAPVSYSYYRSGRLLGTAFSMGDKFKNQ